MDVGTAKYLCPPYHRPFPEGSDPLLVTSDRRIDRAIGRISSHDPGSNPALPPRPAVSATASTISIYLALLNFLQIE